MILKLWVWSFSNIPSLEKSSYGRDYINLEDQDLQDLGNESIFTISVMLL